MVVSERERERERDESETKSIFLIFNYSYSFYFSKIHFSLNTIHISNVRTAIVELV